MSSAPSGPLRRRRPRLSDEVADYVREQIVSGRIRAGAFVRPEKVAEELELSATPAREGLLILVAEGLLKVQPRRGFSVVDLSPADVADIFVAQALLAGELAARACTRLTDGEVEELHHLHAGIEEAAKAGEFGTVQELNDRFHRLVYRVAAAPRILGLLETTLGYAPRLLWTTIEGWPQLTVHDHRDILDALRDRDADRAREAMRRHLTKAGEVLARRLEGANTAK